MEKARGEIEQIKQGLTKRKASDKSGERGEKKIVKGYELKEGNFRKRDQSNYLRGPLDAYITDSGSTGPPCLWLDQSQIKFLLASPFGCSRISGFDCCLTLGIFSSCDFSIDKDNKQVIQLLYS